MICVSLANLTFLECREAIARVEMAEIRLDLSSFSESETQELFSSPKPLIATCRMSPGREEEAGNIMRQAILAGAAYIDLDVETPASTRNRLLAIAKSRGCQVILSHHDFQGMPPREILQDQVEECFLKGADIAKIACQANQAEECARLLSLYDVFAARKNRLVAIAMGEVGVISRIAAPYLGAPFTYASWRPELETAPGQVEWSRLQEIFQRIPS